MPTATSSNQANGITNFAPWNQKKLAMPKETTHNARKSPNKWPGAIEQFRFNTHSTDQPLCPVVLSVPKNQGERPERALVVGEKSADILWVLLNAWTYKKLKSGTRVKHRCWKNPHRVTT
jgi:hypothetical protein